MTKKDAINILNKFSMDYACESEKAKGKDEWKEGFCCGLANGYQNTIDYFIDLEVEQ